jgi:phage antirepressor YoqD-like protein
MNQEIRNAIKASGVKQWQVAKQCGVTEYTFIRWLRDELSEERKKAIYAAIEALSCKGA